MKVYKIPENLKTIIFDILAEKVTKINNRVSPIADTDITNYLATAKHPPQATTNFSDLLDADFTIICTPTNYDEIANQFDCTSVEQKIVKLLETKTTIVIKSTIPITSVS